MTDSCFGEDSKTLFEMRCTTKALSESAWPVPAQTGEVLRAVLGAARWAPFHKPASREFRRGDQAGVEPWRCYTLDAKQCRALRLRLLEAGDTTKIPKMLAVADYLLQVTWLPEPRIGEGGSLFEPSIQNMEHIAAASAAIQNMLLAATELEVPNYWSSGGGLRSREVFELMGIGESEILLGSIFLFPKDLPGANVRGGALRQARGELAAWSRSVVL